MTCFDLGLADSHRVWQLDACGRIVVATPAALDVMPRTFTIAGDGFVETTRDSVKAINGKTCIDKKSCFDRDSATVTFETCRTNLGVQGLLGGWTVPTDTDGNSTVYDDVSPDCKTKTLHELIFKDESDECDAGGNPQCVAFLFSVASWHPTGDMNIDTANGNIMFDRFEGRTTKLPARLFELFPGSVPTGELAHWAPYFSAPLWPVTSWKRTLTAVDCPVITTSEECDLRLTLV